jgi:hypothetical protein
MTVVRNFDFVCGKFNVVGIRTGNGGYVVSDQGRGVHVTGVSAAYTFKLNKNILSE